MIIVGSQLKEKNVRTVTEHKLKEKYKENTIIGIGDVQGPCCNQKTHRYLRSELAPVARLESKSHSNAEAIQA